MVNQRRSFSSDSDRHIANSQFMTPNPNLNGFSSDAFDVNEQTSAFPPYDFFDFFESSEFDSNKHLQTPNPSMDPTFNRNLVATNFSNQNTPATIPMGTFPPFNADNRNDSHTNVTIQTQFSPVVPNVMNTQSCNNVGYSSEPMLSTPNSSTGLRNSPQQFSSPLQSQAQRTPKSKSGPIGLGLNTDQINATPQAPPQMQSFQNTQRQSPLQQSLNWQQPPQFQSHMTKLSPYEKANAMFQQQIHTQDFVQLQNDLESTRKFRSESSLHLQTLIKEEQEKQNNLATFNALEMPKQRLSKPKRVSTTAAKVEQESVTPNTSSTEESLASLSNPLFSQRSQSVEKNDDMDSPTTIEVTSPQSSIDDSLSNPNTGTFFESKNITAEELLNDDHFEDLVSSRSNTKEFLSDLVNFDVNVDIDLNDPAYAITDILASKNGSSSKIQANSVTSTPRKKKPTVVSSSTTNKMNTKKILKKSSSFNGSPSILSNPKFHKTIKTTPATNGGVIMGTFPVANKSANDAPPVTTGTAKSPVKTTAGTGTTGKATTGAQKRSMSSNQVEMFSSMPLFTMGNHYSFVYEHGEGLGSGSSVGGAGRSTNHHRSLSGRRSSTSQEANGNRNVQSRMFEFQVELKK
ncbi:hypothetical protein CANMA_004107 [Candida margitis]|uniref:uncharacterized protein n=1 Tax=Candida margitis TaxID=1775924 RepID=UPI002226BE01|nr:uncharacterized protein CANMA_004107 [Candida margitis]KAI5959671.1 hypothetical protein CANMA_004107 [Candida margitis]